MRRREARRNDFLTVCEKPSTIFVGSAVNGRETILVKEFVSSYHCMNRLNLQILFGVLIFLHFQNLLGILVIETV